MCVFSLVLVDSSKDFQWEEPWLACDWVRSSFFAGAIANTGLETRNRRNPQAHAERRVAADSRPSSPLSYHPSDHPTRTGVTG